MATRLQQKKEIEALIETEQAAIQSGELVVLYIDQCHLHWGDVCGYGWGPSETRITIPIVNERERQTYYGAINPLTREIIAIVADAGNGYWTQLFVEHLREHYKEQRLLICWDGASYHRGHEMHDYLEVVNFGRGRKEWVVHCIHFAPYAPEQNPIEEVWNQAKAFVRKNWHQCDQTFASVKRLFAHALETLTFNFDKLHMYTQNLQII